MQNPGQIRVFYKLGHTFLIAYNMTGMTRPSFNPGLQALTDYTYLDSFLLLHHDVHID